ncbi:hypothetical protein PUN28_011220 [Cardiocondyla obscurior]|uniref:Uncharacterized protein n=1 Tax=Cardiocondyla obscurior TaxID=286306 RepID=A0AAW2FMD3_9HYME
MKTLKNRDFIPKYGVITMVGVPGPAIDRIMLRRFYANISTCKKDSGGSQRRLSIESFSEVLFYQEIYDRYLEKKFECSNNNFIKTFEACYIKYSYIIFAHFDGGIRRDTNESCERSQLQRNGTGARRANRSADSEWEAQN